MSRHFVFSFKQPSTLLTGLVSYWKMDETSGNRADSADSNTLVDNNTVTSGTGIINNAASFNRTNNEYFTRADSNLSYNSTNGRTWAGWINPTSSASSYPMILTRKGASREWEIFLNGGNFLFWWNGGSNVILKTLNLDSGWHFFVVTAIGQGGGSVTTLDFDDSGSPASGTVPGSLNNDASATTLIGQYNTATDPDGSYNGLIDEVGIWDKVLSAAEQTELYNSGAGKTYPF